MKKYISILLFAALILSLCMFPLADNTQELNDMIKTNTTEVSYNVNAGYVVTIPATVELTSNEVKKTVSVSNVVLDAFSKLSLTVKSANSYEVKNGTASVPYTVTLEDESTLSGNTAKEILKTAVAKDVKLTFTMGDTQNASVAGKYIDTLTFEVTEVKPKSFTVGGKSYYFDEGMTWAQFIASDYNVDGFTSDGDTICTSGEKQILTNDDSTVKSGIITESDTYTIAK